MRLEHALHNETVCLTLNSMNIAPDWVVTTAFYSSLHFLQHKLFPLVVEEKGANVTYQNFDEYLKMLVYTKGREPKKHTVLLKLAKKHCQSIGGKYGRLLDLCMNARYHEFRVDAEISNLSVKLLQQIKTHCHSETNKTVVEKQITS